MGKSDSGALFLIPFVLIQLLTVSQQQQLGQLCISARGNYTSNSTYEVNLNTLLNSFSNTTADGGFYNSSAGEVRAIGLCRGDLTPDACRSCIETSSHGVRRLCPNYKEAVIYYETCMLRYSNRSIFGIWEAFPLVLVTRTKNFSDVDEGKLVIGELLSRLFAEASAGSLLKYAVGEAVAGFETMYALVQCTPDLQERKCRDCLVSIRALVPTYSHERVGFRLFGPSCNIRYDTYRFYQSPSGQRSPSPSPSPSPSTSDTSGNGKNRRRSTIVIAVSTVASVVLVFCICICIFLKVRSPKEQVENVEEIIGIESLRIDLNSIKVATENFSDANKLGQGGFGNVYKGKLSNGQDIAVKRLPKDSQKGELEFKNEAVLVAKLQHRNLVRFLGFCLEGTEKVLIYEYMPNESLDQFIFDPVKCSQLNWRRRYKIIEGIARGLVYLHQDSRIPIIHCDLKANNIMLDEEMNPKISDFGMARILLADQTQGETSRTAGSYGHMTPEYAMDGKFSIKSDVYSFGVLTLEITSGRKSNCSQNEENVEDLLNYAWKRWIEGTISSFIDPTLRPDLRSEITRCIQIALLCVQENVADRPTMASVVLMLCSDSLPLPIPSKPLVFCCGSIEQEPIN